MTINKTFARLLAAAIFMAASPLAPTGAQPPAPEERSAPARWHFANGLTVEHIPRQPDDMERLLDVRMWKFRLQMTKPNTGLHCELELREEGREPILISGVGEPESEVAQRDLTMGILPMQFGLVSSEKLKLHLFSNELSSTDIRDNPFKEFGTAYDDVDSDAVKDAIPLLRSELWPLVPDENGEKIPRILRLVLKVKAEPRMNHVD